MGCLMVINFNVMLIMWALTIKQAIMIWQELVATKAKLQGFNFIAQQITALKKEFIVMEPQIKKS